ncbi:MAG: hypothetical protein PHY82_06475 [Lentisphaeria bacterium]|nr:hypothetical protein [Lentisphaeria bacterium]
MDKIHRQLANYTAIGIFHVLAVLVLQLCSGVVAAPQKLALAGPAEYVEPVLALLSGTREFELFEREEIARVLQEHQLSAGGLSGTALAQLFPHCDLFAVITEKRVVVFQAKTGFRLIDSVHDGDAELIAAEIRRSALKVAVQAPLFLATVALRDVGVPARQAGSLEDFVTGIERGLLADPRIQVLERKRLGLVHAERELTRANLSLIPSAILLTFEFEPVQDGDRIRVKILMHDLAGNESGRVETADISLAAGEIQGCVEEILEKIEMARPSVSRKQEALRFFKEYEQMLRAGNVDRKAILSRLEAVLTLEPMNLQFRKAELYFHRQGLVDCPPGQRLALSRAQFQRCMKIRADFPSHPEALWDINELHGYASLPGLGDLSPEDRQGMLALCKEARPYLLKELAWKRPNKPDTPGSINAMSNEALLLQQANRPQVYCDHAAWLKGRLEDATKFLQRVIDFAAQNPGQGAEIAKKKLDCPIRLDEWKYGTGTLRVREIPVVRGIFLEYFASCGDFLALAEQSPFREAKLVAASLRFQHRVLAEKNCSSEQFKRFLFEYLSAVDRIDASILQMPNVPGDWGDGASSMTFKDLLEVLGLKLDAAKLRVEWQKANGRATDWGLFYEAAMGGDYETMIKYSEAARRFNYQRLTKNSVATPLSMCVWQIFNPENQNRDAGLKALQALNADFTVDYGRWSERYDHHGLQLDAAASFGDEIWLVFHSFGAVQFISRWDDPELRLPLSLKNFRMPEVQLHSDSVQGTAVDENHIVIAESKKRLGIYDRREKSWLEVKDLHPVPLRQLLLHHGLIYLAAGGRGLAGEKAIFLYCLKPDGSGRRILGSNVRADKQNLFDQMQNASLEGLVPHGENELLLSVSIQKKTVILRYKIREDLFEEVCSFPFSSAKGSLWSQDGRYYFCGYGFSGRIYRFDPDGGEKTWLFSQLRKRLKTDSAEEKPIMLDGYWGLQPPCRFRSEKELWYAGDRSAVILLDRPKESPFLQLPDCLYLFDLGEKGMLFLNKSSWFLVKAKF